MAEKNTLRLLILKSELCNGRVTQWYEASLCAGGSWSAGSNTGGATCIFFRFFFPFIVFLPFGLLPSILIADPF